MMQQSCQKEFVVLAKESSFSSLRVVFLNNLGESLNEFVPLEEFEQN